MIVRSLLDIDDTDHDIKTSNWRSKRIVLASEGVGFSLHETVLYAGKINDFWYAHHVEAVLVIDGRGTLIDKSSGENYELKPGTLYLLDGHEKHRILPETDIRAVCVFNPALTGGEMHDEHGTYPPAPK